MATFQHLRGLTDAQLRLFLFLRERATTNPSHKLTTELAARLANVGEDTVVESLGVLDAGGFITRDKTRIHRVDGIECSIGWTNTKDRQTDTLVKENAELLSRVKELSDGDYGELSSYLAPADASVVTLAEDILGRYLYAEEIWYLSQITEIYKANRVKQVLNQQNVRTTKHPLRAAYSILKNGAKGAAYTKKEEVKEPWRPKKNFDPWEL